MKRWTLFLGIVAIATAGDLGVKRKARGGKIMTFAQFGAKVN
jgi:hypothetical protein